MNKNAYVIQWTNPTEFTLSAIPILRDGPRKVTLHERHVFYACKTWIDRDKIDYSRTGALEREYRRCTAKLELAELECATLRKQIDTLEKYRHATLMDDMREKQ